MLQTSGKISPAEIFLYVHTHVHHRITVSIAAFP